MLIKERWIKMKLFFHEENYSFLIIITLDMRKLGINVSRKSEPKPLYFLNRSLQDFEKLNHTSSLSGVSNFAKKKDNPNSHKLGWGTSSKNISTYVKFRQSIQSCNLNGYFMKYYGLISKAKKNESLSNSRNRITLKDYVNVVFIYSGQHQSLEV
ncbi:hypothetical protein K501DRAFT_272480 [Backusella circina FSU 941]|nr:hypothetical protein K501DRAFT_272480 [Backusella circina FSU 941]